MEKKLTEREMECVAGYVEFPLQKELAAQMGVSTSTVKGHLNLARRKIGAQNMVEAYRILGWLRTPGNN